MDFVFTDPHWGDENLRKIARPEFENTDALDDFMIMQWNKIVKEKDTVYVLGDLGHKNAIDKVMPQLKGKKILILGNHDKYSAKYYERFFHKVYKHPIYYANRIILSHIPTPVEPGIINVHGHTHLIDIDTPFHFNVSVERTNYSPVKMKKFVDYLGTIEKPDYHFLNEWYKDLQKPIDRNTDDLILNENGLIDVEKTKEKRKSKNLVKEG